MPHRFEKLFEDLTSLVESGEVPMSRIDGAVARILRVKFVAGLFEYPFSDRSLLDVVGCKVNLENSVYYLFTLLHTMDVLPLENKKFLLYLTMLNVSIAFSVVPSELYLIYLKEFNFCEHHMINLEQDFLMTWYV